MRSDCEEIPEDFSKADADKAETMEAANQMARASAGCQVYWPAPYQVCGAIKDKYNSLGGPNSFLKYPISNELTNPGNTGKRSQFMVGPIYWSAATGAHPVVNSFMAKWGSKGWEAGFLKYPTTDEIVLSDGVGRRQEFQGGSIYWHPALAPQAASVGGAIRDHWRAAGSETGRFGYPISDEMAVPEQLQSVGTRVNWFHKGAIIWSPTKGAGDAFWEHNADVKIIPGPPIESPCPAAASHPQTPYNCEAMFPNMFGENQIVRYGRQNSDPAPGGGGAFGWMHALLDHNLDIDAIGKVINHAHPIPIGGRTEYQATFRAHGAVVTRVMVRVESGKMQESGAPDDGYPMGVVTGYCKTGPEAGEGRCGDWVNDSIQGNIPAP